MARTPVPVNKGILQEAIKSAIVGKPANFTELCKTSADIYNRHKGKNDKDISFSVVIARIREWNVPNPFGDGMRKPKDEASQERRKPVAVSAPAAKQRGAKPAAPPVSEKDVINQHFKELERITPPKYKGLVAKVKSGSKVSALKLHCLVCCGFARKEVRMCTAMRCPVWTLRPYQGKANVAAENDDPNYVDPDDVEEEEVEEEDDD